MTVAETAVVRDAREVFLVLSGRLNDPELKALANAGYRKLSELLRAVHVIPD